VGPRECPESSRVRDMLTSAGGRRPGRILHPIRLPGSPRVPHALFDRFFSVKRTPTRLIEPLATLRVPPIGGYLSRLHRAHALPSDANRGLDLTNRAASSFSALSSADAHPPRAPVIFATRHLAPLRPRPLPVPCIERFLDAFQSRPQFFHVCVQAGPPA